MAPVGLVSRMVGPASPRGWPSGWEDVVAMAAGRGPVVSGPSAEGVLAVAIMVETAFVGGRPSGWGVIVAVGASACEERPSGWEVSVTAEVGAAATEECLAELRGAVAMVPEGRT